MPRTMLGWTLTINISCLEQCLVEHSRRTSCLEWCLVEHSQKIAWLERCLVDYSRNPLCLNRCLVEHTPTDKSKVAWLARWSVEHPHACMISCLLRNWIWTLKGKIPYEAQSNTHEGYQISYEAWLNSCRQDITVCMNLCWTPTAKICLRGLAEIRGNHDDASIKILYSYYIGPTE